MASCRARARSRYAASMSDADVTRDPSGRDGTEVDAVVIGAGLSGLVTATELTAAGKRVILLDQEPERSLGGQAWWSFGGLFLVDSPEQRRVGVRDDADLAFADWLGSARFAAGADRGEGPDRHGYAWAKGFVEFAAGDMRSWLRAKGVSWFPLVQWAERGGYPAGTGVVDDAGSGLAHGNTVPRFHVTWGTGPGILEPFVVAAREAHRAGLLDVRFRHRVVEVTRAGGAVTGVRAQILAADDAPADAPFSGRGAPSSRTVTGEVELRAQAVVVASGGIGANHDLARDRWPESAGRLPTRMLSGVPDSTDGLMIGIAREAGAGVVHEDRMWHYPEGIANHSPVWTDHGIRILPGPSSLWIDADGGRLPAPLYPGFDALGALAHITSRGDDHSWFVLNRTIMEKEFALSGSEQNPDLTGRSVPKLIERVRGKAVPVRTFAERSPEFIWGSTPDDLAAGMNALTDATPGSAGHIDAAALARLIAARDAQVLSGLGKDPQVVATRAARSSFWVDRRIRVAPPRALTDPADGPLLPM